VTFFFLSFCSKTKIRNKKKGKNGILYRTSAPKLDVLSPIPNPKISVNNKQNIKKGSLKILNMEKGLVIISHTVKIKISKFSIPESHIVGEPTSQI
jgi:hypothetical protein